MVRVILIDKGCNIKTSEIKNLEIDKLYKKCNLRKKDNFDLRHTWSLNKENLYISIFSKNKGRANSENKYDLPPPLDNDLYFGSILLVKHKNKKFTSPNDAKDIEINEWNKLYEKLFGGFEDLNDEDSYSEEEEIPEHLKTKEGYSKEDGFIVDDDEDLDEEYIPDEEEEEEAHSSTDSADEDEEIMGEESEIENSEYEEESDEDEYEESQDELGSELSEEEYVDSDCN